MPVVGLDILERGAYEDGREWGSAGAYERVDALVHYGVDPAHASNKTIVDLAAAERGADGLVHYSGDLTILRPVEIDKGNRALLLQVPNRGRRLLGRFHMTAGETGSENAVLPGDGAIIAEAGVNHNGDLDAAHRPLHRPHPRPGARVLDHRCAQLHWHGSGVADA